MHICTHKYIKMYKSIFRRLLVQRTVGKKGAEDWKSSTKGVLVEKFFNITTNKVNEGE